MTSNPEIIRKTAINFLCERNLKYNLIGGVSFHAKGTKHSKHDFDYWVVPFTYTVFQEEDAFIYINDTSQQVMYMLTSHGFIHTNKQISANFQSDDEEQVPGSGKIAKR